MTDRNEQELIDRYLSDCDGQTTADVSKAPPDESEAELLARCDAVMALTPKLKDSEELAWAFDEARRLARFGVQPKSGGSNGWLRSPWPAWSVAAMLAVALIYTSLRTEPPETEGLVDTGAQTADTVTPVTNITFGPIVISPELARTLAEVCPVVLLDDQTPVDSRSLALMPFTASMNAAASQAGGISADAIYRQVFRQLSAVPGVYLIDPATAAIYADSELTPDEIARQLGVRGIVDGNIDSINGSIHFNLNFVDAANQGSSVSESIARPTTEAALLQTDITSTVLGALARTLPTDPRDQIL